MFGAAAMSLSSFCVVTNALRLNLFRLYDSSKDKKRKAPKIKEIKTMEKTMNIKGMMCGHCSGAVKKALEAMPEVVEAIVSFENGKAIVKMTEELPEEILKDVVEKEGFEVLSIQ